MKTLKERLDAASDDSPDSRISQSEIISIMDIHIVDLNAALADSRRREIALEERVKEAYLELSCAGYVDYNKVRNILKSILKETEAKP